MMASSAGTDKTIRAMAETMVDLEAAQGFATDVDLMRAGYLPSQIRNLGAEARAKATRLKTDSDRLARKLRLQADEPAAPVVLPPSSRAICQDVDDSRFASARAALALEAGYIGSLTAIHIASALGRAQAYLNASVMAPDLSGFAVAALRAAIEAGVNRASDAVNGPIRDLIAQLTQSTAIEAETAQSPVDLVARRS